ncbi:MAG TPA: hypothetical protein DEG42_01585 [Acholeplasmataceae bacterium]|nr:MAG: hypothetical protein A2Y43_01330 [Tenericutes bacterium GWA2_38_26]OHE32012.1 MAG: hypothetical protein A2009_03325 [Tenericutes bacterium GWD2_38_27]OHE35462.1 MAG: hypothetical protein A2013_04485 [Tenericutes bacterium GWE2_38_8]HBG32890.1 hypothetical protein [Acholeplasmataceae bacterium]HBY65075.1 hypothetical protein [Acholeplasmataceae bacterium]
MREQLAKKSIKQIIANFIILVFILTIIYFIFNYYYFRFELIDIEMKIILFALGLGSIALVMQLYILITNPNILMEYDQDGVYVHKRDKMEYFIRFKDMFDVHATVNIWTKPFLVYSALVIKTKESVSVIRNIEKMAEVRDFIHHMAFEKNE